MTNYQILQLNHGNLQQQQLQMMVKIY